MMIENERLKSNYNIALGVVKEVLGEKAVKENMRQVTKVSISPRAVSRNGCCKYRNGKCEIEVSKHLFEVADKEMITTLIHEIIHTFKDTRGHNARWQWYAKKISNNSPYTITRTRDIEGIDNKDKCKYKITCCKCGNVIYQMRMTNRIKNAYKNNHMLCGRCRHNEFIVEDLKEN